MLMSKSVPIKKLTLPQLSRLCVNGFFRVAPPSSAHAPVVQRPRQLQAGQAESRKSEIL